MYGAQVMTFVEICSSLPYTLKHYLSYTRMSPALSTVFMQHFSR